LGTPPKIAQINRKTRKQVYQNEIARNAIQRKFGQRKRGFERCRVMCILVSTIETSALLNFPNISLERRLTAILFLLLYYRHILNQIVRPPQARPELRMGSLKQVSPKALNGLNRLKLFDTFFNERSYEEEE
jgi:hypothetical protein